MAPLLPAIPSADDLLSILDRFKAGTIEHVTDGGIDLEECVIQSNDMYKALAPDWVRECRDLSVP